MPHYRKASQSAVGAPVAIVPEFIGQLYLNESTNEVWVATGLQAGDWMQTGVQGPQGLVGDVGLQGAVGDTGAQGPVGDTGAQGPVGDTGAQGPIGDTGAQGSVGDTGAQGPVGDTGAQGPQGAQGPGGTRFTPEQITVTAGHVSNGYFDLTNEPTAPEKVDIFMVGGVNQLNADYSNVTNPDFDCGDSANPKRVYIRDGTYGAYEVSGLSEDIAADDVLICTVE